MKKPYPSENGIPPMTARERAFAAELRGETPVRRYAPGEPVAFLPMEALNGDVGRVAREVALETGYRRPAGTEDMDWFGNKRNGNGIIPADNSGIIPVDA